MENPIKMDDLGGTPIFGNTQLSQLDVFFFFAVGDWWVIFLRTKMAVDWFLRYSTSCGSSLSRSSMHADTVTCLGASHCKSTSAVSPPKRGAFF